MLQPGALANPPRRGRPPKHRPWQTSMDRLLKLAGLNPYSTTFDELIQTLRRSKLGEPAHRLHWSDCAVVPLDTAAKALGCSNAQMYRMARTGEIELVRSGGRTCAVVQSIQAYLDRIRRAGWTPSNRHVAALRGRRRKLNTDIPAQ